MTTQPALVLVILCATFALFVSGRVKPDLVAMLSLVALVLTGSVAPAEAFSGFSSYAVITIAGLMVIGDGLEKTGVVQWVAQRLEKIIHKNYNRLLLVNTGIPGLLSGFINIIAAATFFIPVILRLCTQMKVPQSKILLPMACMALVGANLSLIGASHNLVVDSLLEEATGQGFGFFEFSVVGMALLLVSLVYIFLVGQHLLPGKKVAPQPEKMPVIAHLVEVYQLENLIFEVWLSGEIKPGELHLGDLDLQPKGMRTIAVVRGGELATRPRDDLPLEDGDMLLIKGDAQTVEAFAEQHELLTFLGAPSAQKRYALSTAELAEAVVPPRSPAIGKTVRQLHMVEEFGMTAIAWFRDGQPHPSGARDVPLRAGDSLLVYGPRDRMREFEPEKDLLVYFKPGAPEVTEKMKSRAPLAAAILIAVVVVAALDWLPIAASAVAGAVLAVVFNIVPINRVYAAIDWRTLVLIGGMYPLGIALDQSGAADLIGVGLNSGLGQFGPLAVLAGVAVLCMVLTQPIHNAAVAVIMTPIGITAANAMGSDPKAFCVAVVVACGAAFLMPYGHPAPYLVQEPGGYRLRDYLRFGIGLNILTLAVILVLIPQIWTL